MTAPRSNDVVMLAGDRSLSWHGRYRFWVQMLRPRALFMSALLLCPAFPSQAASPTTPSATSFAPPSRPTHYSKGRTTGLSLPRFASLRADSINLRVGPGTRYPTEWVLRRSHLPIEIIEEYQFWRSIRLPDGTKGWVHQSLLSGRRCFVISGARKTLRRKAYASAGAVAVLRAGVVGQIQSCKAGALWCRVEVGQYTGFLKRADIWGTYKDEAVQD